jgi:uncharacterized membrane protein YphA (DoxX/SURF4 family)
LGTADGFARAIGGFAKTDPLHAYTGVMAPVVLGAPGVFGPLFVLGMLAAGIGIMLGVFTRVALAGGVWLSLNSLLMGFGAGSVHHSINVLMLALEIGFLWTGAWRPYSRDELLVGFRARSRPQRAAVGHVG